MSTNPDTRYDDRIQRLGNPELGGYSCVVWSIDVSIMFVRSEVKFLDWSKRLTGAKGS